jgi:hypothetical protein
VVIEKAQDKEWLEKATSVTYEHWRIEMSAAATKMQGVTPLLNSSKQQKQRKARAYGFWLFPFPDERE